MNSIKMASQDLLADLDGNRVLMHTPTLAMACLAPYLNARGVRWHMGKVVDELRYSIWIDGASDEEYKAIVDLLNEIESSLNVQVKNVLKKMGDRVSFVVDRLVQM